METLSLNMEKQTISTGQSFSVSFNQIILGDCIEVLKNLDPSMTFDIVIADPPYNIGKNFGNNQDNLNLRDYVNWSCRWKSFA